MLLLCVVAKGGEASSKTRQTGQDRGTNALAIMGAVHECPLKTCRFVRGSKSADLEEKTARQDQPLKYAVEILGCPNRDELLSETSALLLHAETPKSS